MSKPLILLASLGLAATASAADITVSPNDPNALTKARDTARAGDRIILRGGTYRLSEPLVLGPQHSGVTWMAAPGEKPVISGGVPVTGWTPDPANPKIFQAKVDLDNFRQIWINGVRGQRARGRVPAGLAPLGENKGVLKPRATPAGLTLNPGGFPPGSAMQLSDLGEFPPSGFTTSDERLLTWRNPQDIEMGGRIAWNQASFMVSKISKVDGKVVLEVAQPGYFICTNMAGAPMRGPGWMENAYELIDQPGEWYFDRPAKTLFYLPRPGEDLAKAEIIAPRLETLVRVEGTIDKPVQGLRFEGLTFSHATWLRLSSPWGFPNIQGNFCVSPENGYMRAEGGWVNLSDEFLKTPGNVVVHAGHGIRFDSCTFTALGGSGLDLEYGSQNNVVSRCRFFDIAANGVQIGDLQRHDHHPDDPRLIVKDNQLIDSEITKVCADYPGGVGVFYGYTEGTVIAHNRIHDLPYSGISGGWGWGRQDVNGRGGTVKYTTATPCSKNRIEYNDIRKTMLVLHDGGPIYTLGRQEGTVIRGNVYAGNGEGIYLDSGSDGIHITGNLALMPTHHFLTKGGTKADNYETTLDAAAAPVKARCLDVPPGVVDPKVTSLPNLLTVVASVQLDWIPKQGDPRRWIFAKDGNEHMANHLSLLVNKGKLMAFLNHEGGVKALHQITGHEELPVDTLLTLAMTWDGQTLRIHAQGKEIGSERIDIQRTSGNRPVVIGARDPGMIGFDCGHIKEIRLYDRVLAAADLVQMPTSDQGLIKSWTPTQPPLPEACLKTAREILQKAGPRPVPSTP